MRLGLPAIGHWSCLASTSRTRSKKLAACSPVAPAIAAHVRKRRRPRGQQPLRRRWQRRASWVQAEKLGLENGLLRVIREMPRQCRLMPPVAATRVLHAGAPPATERRTAQAAVPAVAFQLAANMAKAHELQVLKGAVMRVENSNECPVMATAFRKGSMFLSRRRTSFARCGRRQASVPVELPCAVPLARRAPMRETRPMPRQEPQGNL